MFLEKAKNLFLEYYSKGKYDGVSTSTPTCPVFNGLHTDHHH